MEESITERSEMNSAELCIMIDFATVRYHCICDIDDWSEIF